MPDLKQDVVRACECLRSGGVVGYPTETVWGLAARPESLRQLQERKGRDAAKAVQLSCADVTTALRLAQAHRAWVGLRVLWPGPLTVVAPAAPSCPANLAPGGQVGLRVPAHPLAQQLLQVCGPLATTSLNPAGKPAALTYAQAQDYALADLLLGGPQDVAGGEASTVIRLPPLSGDVVEVLRHGALPPAIIARALEPLGLRLEETRGEA